MVKRGRGAIQRAGPITGLFFVLLILQLIAPSCSSVSTGDVDIAWVKEVEFKENGKSLEFQLRWLDIDQGCSGDFTFMSNTDDQGTLILTKTDCNGTVLWSKRYQAEHTETLSDTPENQTWTETKIRWWGEMIASSGEDGGNIIYGGRSVYKKYYSSLETNWPNGSRNISQSSTSDFDYRVFKVASNGTIGWHQKIEGFTRLTDMIGFNEGFVCIGPMEPPKKMVPTGEGEEEEVYVYDEDFEKVILVKHYDKDGKLTFEMNYTEGDYCIGKKIIETSDGNLLLAAVSSNYTQGFIGPLFLKIDKSGNIKWRSLITSSFTYEIGSFNDILEVSNGFVLLAGPPPDECRSRCEDLPPTVFKIGLTGNLVWNYTYPGLEFNPRFLMLDDTGSGSDDVVLVLGDIRADGKRTQLVRRRDTSWKLLSNFTIKTPDGLPTFRYLFDSDNNTFYLVGADDSIKLAKTKEYVIIDSDGDGYDDEEEETWGTDPNDSSSNPGRMMAGTAVVVGILVALTVIAVSVILVVKFRRKRGDNVQEDTQFDLDDNA